MSTYEPSIFQIDRLDQMDVPKTLYSASTDPSVDLLEILLLNFTDRYNYFIIRKSMNNLQVVELLSILIYCKLKHSDFGTPFVQTVLYEDCAELAYVNIVFENCNWSEWKSLEIELMEYQYTLRGMVAITCLSGLRE